jgi:hypothetical protein
MRRVGVGVDDVFEERLAPVRERRVAKLARRLFTLTAALELPSRPASRVDLWGRSLRGEEQDD